MNSEIEDIILRALEEDLPQGDITSESIIPAESSSEAVFLAKEPGIIAGLDVAKEVFIMIDPAISFTALKRDGDAVQKGEKLAELSGSSISLLKGERTALNLLQRLSGIATTTRRFVDAIQGSSAQILDTRKTTPGLRVLEKYAVKMGGGTNHRKSLSDMVLIKDNHIKIVEGIQEAVRLARTRIPGHIKIEVETTCLDEVAEALMSGADMIMLDNMTADTIKEAVALVDGKVPLEVSGNVTLESVKRYAELGVDFISVGSLTHSYKSLDISMEITETTA